MVLYGHDVFDVLQIEMKSKEIAISAIASAFTAICLLVGIYFSVIDLISLVLSSIFVIMPLYYHSYKGAFLCYLCSGVIAVLLSLVSGLNILSIVTVCYFFFFGISPIVIHRLYEKRVKRIIITAIIIIWSIALFYGGYYYYTLVLKLPFTSNYQILNDNILICLGVLAVVFAFVFDRYIVMIKAFLDRYLKKIIKD